MNLGRMVWCLLGVILGVQIVIWNIYHCYLHFIHGETETQRVSEICLFAIIWIYSLPHLNLMFKYNPSYEILKGGTFKTSSELMFHEQINGLMDYFKNGLTMGLARSLICSLYLMLMTWIALGLWWKKRLSPNVATQPWTKPKRQNKPFFFIRPPVCGIVLSNKQGLNSYTLQPGC